MPSTSANCASPFHVQSGRAAYTHFLVKGLEQVRGEWTLMTLAYNWKRVLNLVNLGALLAAVQKSAVQPA